MAESLCALTLHRRPPLPQVLTAMSPDANPTPNSPPQVLTAMNRFLNEDNGLQMAFLDGNTSPTRTLALTLTRTRTLTLATDPDH